ncbi:Tetratricopeptide TPR_1 repeat-containing protein [Stanieria cyanosphaera PCC 7437]|uniref:Tetratricopeptide TPR_1 repeat-containing protein n=1 Tax=Stanieria cyanosphaera (strain ATCC 29371 / PCC 7437) TaxID=111780 RepID=K9XQ31_STAC7|nr:tetratricopeptide repeat protein [Stanieria cyanosphaera]AFZ34204.1 Tetratricopeptide TPR_1 repeat-containing protein [Stanieria cyanosphaera PCC 7437]
MLRRIKQQSNQQPNSDSAQASPDSNINETAILSDADYEFLFGQLLEGVAHGWHQGRIAKFFQQLEERGKPEAWIAWLERFGQKTSLATTPSMQQLGARMIRLGELTQSTPSVRQIGAVANRIGRQLFYGSNNDLIWEYDGPDLQIAQIKPLEEEETLIHSSASFETEESISGSKQVVEEISNVALETDTENQSLENLSDSSTSDQTASISTEEDFAPAFNLDQDFSELASSWNHPSTLTQSEDEVANLTWQPNAEDDQLSQAISQQLELTESDPQTLANTLIDDINSVEHQPTLELVEGWFNLGLKQATAGDFDGAVMSWEKALEINPNLSAAWHNRGSALGRLGKYSEAIESFDQALVIDPNNYQAWNDRGHALYQLQKWEEAVASWDKAIEILPGDYQFWYNRGCALEKLQRSEESIASYEKALEIKPDFQEAHSRYIDLLTDNPNIN